MDMFQTYKAKVENQPSKTIKMVRSDRGGAYDLTSLVEYCALNGIIHQTTAPYTPQQNGEVERKNKILKEMANPMLNNSGVPHNLWGMPFLWKVSS